MFIDMYIYIKLNPNTASLTLPLPIFSPRRRSRTRTRTRAALDSVSSARSSEDKRNLRRRWCSGFRVRIRGQG